MARCVATDGPGTDHEVGPSTSCLLGAYYKIMKRVSVSDKEIIVSLGTSMGNKRHSLRAYERFLAD